MKKILLIALLSHMFLGAAYAQSVPTQVTTIGSGSGSGPNKLGVMNNKLYFMADVNLHHKKSWSYDGTNLALASEFPQFGLTQLGERYYPLQSLNGKYYIDGHNLAFPSQSGLYWGDGTDTFKMVTGTISLSTNSMCFANNRVYGIGSDGTNTHLAYIDASNVPQSAAILHSYAGSRNMVVCNNKLYFDSYDNMNLGIELYVYDLSSNILTQIPAINTTWVDGTFPQNLCAGDNGKVYYSAHHPSEGRELYEISGTSTPVKLTSLNSINDGVEEYDISYNGYYQKSILQKGNNVYFSGNNGAGGDELMKYDLTTSQSTMVKDIDPGLNSSAPRYFTDFGGKVYFSATNGASGRELWVTDGTTAGTTMVADVNPGAGDSDPKHFTIYNNRLYFAATNGTSGVEVYRLGNPLGIETVSKTNGIKVYPVPAQDILTFDIDLLNPESLSISLTDITGKKVLTSPQGKFAKGSAIVNMSVKDLPSGVYSYSIYNASGEFIGSGKISH